MRSLAASERWPGKDGASIAAFNNMKTRRTFDDRGNPVVEKKNRDGLYERELNSTAIRKLSAEALKLADPKVGGPIPKGNTPYGPRATIGTKKLRNRSSLDYLRELSVEIRRRQKDEGKE